MGEVADVLNDDNSREDVDDERRMVTSMLERRETARA